MTVAYGSVPQPHEPPMPHSVAPTSHGADRFAAIVRMGVTGLGLIAVSVGVAGRISLASTSAHRVDVSSEQLDRAEPLQPSSSAALSAGGTTVSTTEAGLASMYKRTHMSKNATADGEFIQANLGPTASYYKTSDVYARSATAQYGTPACVHRAQFMREGMLTDLIMHYVDDFFFHEGNTSSSDWISSRLALHGDLANFAGWDRFMHDSVAYFAPSLDGFVEAWTERSTGYLAYTYTNPVCGSTMYVAMMTVPNTGDMIEVHSGAVSDEYVSLFATELKSEPNACAESYSPSVSLADMTASWTALMDAVDDDGSDTRTMPHVLPFRVSVPAASFDYLDRLTASESHIVGEIKESRSSDTTPGCKWRESVQSTYGTSNYTISLRVISNKDARDAEPGYTLSEYENYTKAVRAKYMGFDHGWDRYIDDHIGWYLPVAGDAAGDDDSAYYEQFKLDTFGRKFETNLVHYKGHYSGTESTNSGSLWTDYFVGGGVGVEFAGNYDWSYFNTSDTTELSFCDESSVGAPAKIEM